MTEARKAPLSGFFHKAGPVFLTLSQGRCFWMIYFDNAATSFPKPLCVRRAALEAIRDYGGNPGRSGHALSMRAAEKVFAVREQAAASNLTGTILPLRRLSRSEERRVGHECRSRRWPYP